jgi:hypothetical protein
MASTSAVVSPLSTWYKNLHYFNPDISARYHPFEELLWARR